jgi:hypothetical protein
LVDEKLVPNAPVTRHCPQKKLVDVRRRPRRDDDADPESGDVGGDGGSLVRSKKKKSRRSARRVSPTTKPLASEEKTATSSRVACTNRFIRASTC